METEIDTQACSFGATFALILIEIVIFIFFSKYLTELNKPIPPRPTLKLGHSSVSITKSVLESKGSKGLNYLGPVLPDPHQIAIAQTPLSDLDPVLSHDPFQESFSTKIPFVESIRILCFLSIFLNHDRQNDIKQNSFWYSDLGNYWSYPILFVLSGISYARSKGDLRAIRAKLVLIHSACVLCNIFALFINPLSTRTLYQPHFKSNGPFGIPILNPKTLSIVVFHGWFPLIEALLTYILGPIQRFTNSFHDLTRIEQDAYEWSRKLNLKANSLYIQKNGLTSRETISSVTPSANSSPKLSSSDTSLHDYTKKISNTTIIQRWRLAFLLRICCITILIHFEQYFKFFNISLYSEIFRNDIVKASFLALCCVVAYAIVYWDVLPRKTLFYLDRIPFFRVRLFIKNHIASIAVLLSLTSRIINSDKSSYNSCTPGNAAQYLLLGWLLYNFSPWDILYFPNIPKQLRLHIRICPDLIWSDELWPLACNRNNLPLPINIFWSSLPAFRMRILNSINIMITMGATLTCAVFLFCLPPTFYREFNSSTKMLYDQSNLSKTVAQYSNYFSSIPELEGRIYYWIILYGSILSFCTIVNIFEIYGFVVKWLRLSGDRLTISSTNTSYIHHWLQSSYVLHILILRVFPRPFGWIMILGSLIYILIDAAKSNWLSSPYKIGKYGSLWKEPLSKMKIIKEL